MVVYKVGLMAVFVVCATLLLLATVEPPPSVQHRWSSLSEATTRTADAMKSFVLYTTHVVCSVEDRRMIYFIRILWPAVSISWPARMMVDRMKVCTDILLYSVNR